MTKRAMKVASEAQRRQPTAADLDGIWGHIRALDEMFLRIEKDLRARIKLLEMKIEELKESGGIPRRPWFKFW